LFAAAVEELPVVEVVVGVFGGEVMELEQEQPGP